MKILAYSYRQDELEYFKKFSDKYGVEVELTKEKPTLETAHLAKGCECISIITTMINEELLQRFHEIGVKFISTRTIGYDHIDVASAKKLGIEVDNISYSPSSVADYTIMLMLMTTRKVKKIFNRADIQDFSLSGLIGKEMHNLTVGVIGTGKIGKTVIEHLSGFGSKIIAHDLYPNEEVKRYAQYVSLETLFKDSDIITIHAPATKDNKYLIDKESIALMKDGVFVINTARGSLINTCDLIDAIESKQIGGAALDVIENESGLYYNDLKGEVLNKRDLAVLKSFPNVIVTPHTAFYTDQAVSDMVENSISSCAEFMKK